MCCIAISAKKGIGLFKEIAIVVTVPTQNFLV